MGYGPVSARVDQRDKGHFSTRLWAMLGLIGFLNDDACGGRGERWEMLDWVCAAPDALMRERYAAMMFVIETYVPMKGEPAPLTHALLGEVRERVRHLVRGSA